MRNPIPHFMPLLRRTAEGAMVPGAFTILVATTTKVGGRESTTYAEGATVKGRLIDPAQLRREERMIGAAIGTANLSEARLPVGTVVARTARIRHNPSGVVFEVADVPQRDYPYDVRIPLVEVT